MPCKCECHKAPRPAQTCSCCSGPTHTAPPCQPCCGDPEPTGLTPEGPRPVWQAGRPAPSSPWKPGESDDQRWRRFQGVLLNEVRRGLGPGGPVFGKRKDEWLPYLVTRSGPGDNGQRPFVGAFWESPDIFVTSGVPAERAGLVPTSRGGTVVAGQPTTLWAQVWNLGRAPVANARVEFYWCNPSLGISTQSATLIGVAHVDLGARDSGRARTLVKCPVTWFPEYINAGHECLVVRLFEPLTDPLPRPGWFPAIDRHVGQRNITVVEARSPARAVVPLRLGCSLRPGPARLAVERVPTTSVPWLALLSEQVGTSFRDARRIRELVGLLPVTPVMQPQARIRISLDSLQQVSGLLQRSITVQRTCDELETQVVVEVDGLDVGECAVHRVTQQQEGRIAGGYTIITYRPVAE